MHGAKLKYLVDALLYVHTAAVAMLGLLLAFVIPRGPGQDKVFLGLHRHDWSDIHLQLSLLMLALVVLHLALSWRWVASCSSRYLGAQWRFRLWLIGGGWIVLVGLGWLLKSC